MYDLQELERRCHLYCQTYGLALAEPLGFGTDGAVWQTVGQADENSCPQIIAVKIFRYEEQYVRERECYQRLFADAVTEVAGFAVPRLRNYNNRLLGIEIDIIEPPRILDFGKAYLDQPPDYVRDPIIMRQWRESSQELWGSRWPAVENLLYRLREDHGIWYFDANADNIQFE